ncbi:hypothetical protein HNP98_003341 [Hymenobacter sp. 9A]|uniref:Uncharacterized protein n=1 Tax=Hymenobacter caeli TaxID=2735894 RepID=A0ABX2FTI0_9BACT|nr:hypothetical protein [Hymenobacter caeli]
MMPILACLISGGCGLLLAGLLLDGPAPAGGPVARPTASHQIAPGGPAAKKPAAALSSSPYILYVNDNAR